MAGPRQPLEVVQAKGRKHLTKADVCSILIKSPRERTARQPKTPRMTERRGQNSSKKVLDKAKRTCYNKYPPRGKPTGHAPCKLNNVTRQKAPERVILRGLKGLRRNDPEDSLKQGCFNKMI